MNHELNPEQLEAVQSDGHLLITACPGSGKTWVLEHRAQHLLENPNNEVVAVTFTRDAAKELTKRIKKRIPNNAARRLVTGTFHSLALTQIKSLRGYGKLISEDVRKYYIHEALMATGYELDFEGAIKAIEYYKSFVRPEIDEGPAGRVFRNYQKIMTQHNAIDFNDLILIAIRKMENRIIRHLPGTHMLVDEFQDTDGIQYEWLKHHAKYMHVTAVGDDDQTIYGWRQARGYDGMMEFAHQNHAKHVVLYQNYRCRREILESANNLILNNRGRVAKQLYAALGSGGQVRVEHYKNREAQADAVMRAVKEDPDNWAVLSRGNHNLDRLEKMLKLASVPYHMSRHKSLWKRDHVVCFLGLIEAILLAENIGIKSALLTLDFVPEQIDSIYRICKGNLVTGFDPKQKFDMLPDIEKTIMEEYVENIHKWKNNLTKKRYDLALEGITTWFTKTINNDYIIKDVWLVESTIKEISGAIMDRINMLRVAPEGKQKQGVALYTMHGSKGLEFKNVWIIDCNKGTLPKEKPDDTSISVSEERRLMYVAITRAIQNLVISYTGKESDRSQFITEAGLDGINDFFYQEAL